MLKSDLIKQLRLNPAQFNRLAQDKGVGIKDEYTTEEVAQLNTGKGFGGGQRSPQSAEFQQVSVETGVQSVDDLGAAHALTNTSARLVSDVLCEAARLVDQGIQSEKTQLAREIADEILQSQRQSLQEVRGFLRQRFSGQTLLSRVSLPQATTIDVQPSLQLKSAAE